MEVKKKMNFFSGAFLPDDDNYNHILCVYVPSLHIFFEEKKLFGKDFPLYYKGKYKQILEKYSKNIISDFELDNLKNIKNIKYVEEILNSKLNLKVKNHLMYGANLENINEIIFVKRNDRKISNFIEIKDLIEKNNLSLKEIEFEKLSFDDQIKTSNGSKMMIGVHGAGLTNLMFMEKDAFIVEIDFFNWGFNCYEHLAHNLKMKNYFRFCEEKTKNKHIDIFEINFQKFKTSMEKIIEIFKKNAIMLKT